jgi:hypothetical protein
MTKCSHDLCQNNAATGSSYCNRCIQLPTRECNFCNVEHQQRCGDTTGSLLLDILVELFVCLPLAGLITVGILICYWFGSFLSQLIMGIPLHMISGVGILALLFTIYLLLFLWVRIGSMKIKWSSD